MREWEKRLVKKKGIERIAGRIVESHTQSPSITQSPSLSHPLSFTQSPNAKNIDFRPLHIRRLEEKRIKIRTKKKL